MTHKLYYVNSLHGYYFSAPGQGCPQKWTALLPAEGTGDPTQYSEFAASNVREIYLGTCSGVIYCCAWLSKFDVPLPAQRI